MNNVAIIEDEQDLAESVAKNLQLEGYNTLIFNSAEDFLEAHKSHSFDLLLVDRNLPGLDGLSLVKHIRNSDRSTSILFVTAQIEPEEVVEGLKYGADDYIKKPFSTVELVARMNKCLQLRSEILTPKTNETWNFNEKAREVTYKGERIRLTQTEFELLNLFLKTPNEVIERDILGKHFEHLDINNSRTLDVHISSIRKKVAKFGFQVETIRGIGYRVLTFSNI